MNQPSSNCQKIHSFSNEPETVLLFLSAGIMAEAVMRGFAKIDERVAHENILIHPLKTEVGQNFLIGKDADFYRTKN